MDAACRGLGLAYMPEDIVASQIASGELVRVLEDWCPPFAGYHLYYPSRRQPAAAEEGVEAVALAPSAALILKLPCSP